MDQIITSVFSEISNCSHPWHATNGAGSATNGAVSVRSSGGAVSLCACVDSKAESLANTLLSMVDKDDMREEMKRLVQESITDCVACLTEIGYSTPPGVAQCISQRGDRLVDMAVDLLMDPADETAEELEVRKKAVRCSRRKSCLRKTPKKKKSSRKKSVVWKK